MATIESSSLLNRALQDSNLFDAWLRVRDKAGGAGIDGVTIEDFSRNVLSELPTLRHEILEGGYMALPLRRIELPRRSRPPRVLAIPAIRDRVIQSAVASTLSCQFEPRFQNCSFGYRPRRGVRRAIEYLCAARDSGQHWVAEADIESCFDTIPWAPLLQVVSNDLADTPALCVLRHWIGLALQWPDGSLQARHAGIPQGSPLSPLLCNVYLTGLDRTLVEGDWLPVRYADDFVIAATSESRAQEALRSARAWLESAGLRLNASKTRVVSFEQGFSFLGVRFQGRQVMATKPGTEPWVLPRSPETANKPRRRPSTPTQDDVGMARSDASPSMAKTPCVAASVGRVTTTATQVSDTRLRTLYLTEPGTYLHIRGGRVIVEKNGDELSAFPSETLDQVVANTEGAISFAALRTLLTNRATLSVESSGSAKRSGLFGHMNGRQVRLRIAQFKCLGNCDFVLTLSRRIVQAKISNSRVLLRRYRRLRSQADAGEDCALQRFHANCASVATLESLRGIEGSAARVYFRGLAALLPSEWQFERRTRNPPTDPVNALLSYGYAVLFHNVYTFILRSGLDPYLGMLHTPRDGHPALVSDLMEPYRSLIVDAVVLRLLGPGGVTGSEFASDHPGCIPAHVKRQYIRLLERKLSSPVGRSDTETEILDWRRIIERDIKAWVRTVTDQPNHYSPWHAR